MIEHLYEFSHYAPLVILIATILDIFFLTGYIFYGFAMLSVVSMMLMTNMISPLTILVVASIGTITGNLINYFIGHYLSNTKVVIHHLNKPKINKIRNRIKGEKLFILIAVCRFITFLRPAYALLLGTMKVNTRKFVIYEVVVSLVWVTFWLTVMTQAENLI